MKAVILEFVHVPIFFNHCILYADSIPVIACVMNYSETSIHRFRQGSEKETVDPGKQ
jgi:hypothetical protein